MVEPTQQRKTESLSPNERSLLASTKSGGCGIVVFLCLVGLVGAGIPLGLMAMDSIEIGPGTITMVMVCVFCTLGVVAFATMSADDRLQDDLDEGIKLIVTGRIVHMHSATSEGPGYDGFIHIVTDDTPPQKLVFQVEERLYEAVKRDEAVRIAYVPISKALLELQTASYHYFLRAKQAGTRRTQAVRDDH